MIIDKPTILDFSNSQHNHSGEDQGGKLNSFESISGVTFGGSGSLQDDQILVYGYGYGYDGWTNVNALDYLSNILDFSLQNEPASSAQGLTLPITYVSSGPYTILSTDKYIVFTTGTYNSIFPSATGSGRYLWLKNIGTGVISLIPNGNDTIDEETVQEITEGDGVQITDILSGKWAII